MTEKDIPAGSAPAKSTYRTRRKAGDIVDVPCRLPVITDCRYQNALTFSRGGAGLRLLSHAGALKYQSGKLMYKGLPVKSATLDGLCTDEGTDRVSLALLRALYAVMLAARPSPALENRAPDSRFTFYYPEFARKTGKPRTGKHDICEFTRNMGLLQGVIGIVGDSILPVLSFMEHDAAKNTFTFASPYMEKLIREIYAASLRTDKNGVPLLRKNGEPQTLPSHSYLVDMAIAKEKNKRAVEIVLVIVALIEQAGNHTPHIRAGTVIERVPLLREGLRGKTAGCRNTILKRAFSKAWELLRDRTFLAEAYKGIQLPSPDDASCIPTASRTGMVFSFPHGGKIRNQQPQPGPG